MGAAITKQALDDIHASRLTTPPHMRKMQGSQAGHTFSGRVYNLDVQRQEESEEELLEILQAYQATTKR